MHAGCSVLAECAVWWCFAVAVALSLHARGIGCMSVPLLTTCALCAVWEGVIVEVLFMGWFVCGSSWMVCFCSGLRFCVYCGSARPLSLSPCNHTSLTLRRHKKTENHTIRQRCATVRLCSRLTWQRYITAHSARPTLVQNSDCAQKVAPVYL